MSALPTGTVTLLFTDLEGSTSLIRVLGDRYGDLLNDQRRLLRAVVEQHGGSEVDTAGDGFFVRFDGPARGVRFAEACVQAMHGLDLEIRAGVHTGEIGSIDGKAGGIAVVIGARVAATAGPSEVVVSSTVKDLVAGSGLAFEDAGEHELKGVPDRWRLYRLIT